MVGVTMGGMRQYLGRALDLRSPSADGRRSRQRGGGRVAVLAAVLAFGAVAGVVLAGAGRGFGAAWPYAVQGPVAAVAFGVPAVLVLRREVWSIPGFMHTWFCVKQRRQVALL